METTALTVATVLETIGTVLTEILSMFTEVISFVMANPLMLVGIIIPAALAFIYGGYKLARRVFKRRG